MHVSIPHTCGRTKCSTSAVLHIEKASLMITHVYLEKMYKTWILYDRATVQGTAAEFRHLSNGLAVWRH